MIPRISSHSLDLLYYEPKNFMFFLIEFHSLPSEVPLVAFAHPVGIGRNKQTCLVKQSDVAEADTQ